MTGTPSPTDTVGGFDQRLTQALTIIDNALPAATDRERFGEYAELADHVIAIAHHLEAVDPDEAVRLLTSCGTNQDQRAAYTGALTTLQAAHRIQQSVANGDNTPELAEILTLTGIIQRQLGRFEEAEGTQARALTIKEAVYGPDHPEVAVTLGNLGIVQQRLGRLAEAEGTQARALTIKEAVYGPDHPEVAVTLGNLGIVQGG